MKKSTIILFVITYAFIFTVSWANATSPNSFKLYMHKVFDSYNHARISYRLNKHEITDIHLRQMKEYFALAQKNIPEYDKEGSVIDKMLFIERVAKLQTTISDLRGAVKYRAPLLTELFARDIFNVCIACHKEMKFDYLFSIPQGMTLFGEYMHKVSEHIDLARIYEKNANGDAEVENHIELINYYIDLLKTTMPDAGPSGVILDKETFNRRIEGIQKRLQEHAKGKKQIDLAYVRKTINSLCVACHEPERVK
ncbi:MAG: hypothetical protein GY807_19180 [Gammaproteobacteria bacterium]|nr:hypothetical protein [Gammaproteobacteria bacterium]